MDPHKNIEVSKFLLPISVVMMIGSFLFFLLGWSSSSNFGETASSIIVPMLILGPILFIVSLIDNAVNKKRSVQQNVPAVPVNQVWISLGRIALIIIIVSIVLLVLILRGFHD